MPVFATLVATLLGQVAGFMAKMFAAKLAIRALAVAALTGIGATLMLVFNQVVTPLVAQLFNHEYGQFMGLAFPPVAGTVIAGLTTMWLACATYKLQERAILATAGM